jgi:hypothetical protein
MNATANQRDAIMLVEPAKDEQAHSCSSRLHLGITYKRERMHCTRKGIDDARSPPSEDN